MSLRSNPPFRRVSWRLAGAACGAAALLPVAPALHAADGAPPAPPAAASAAVSLLPSRHLRAPPGGDAGRALPAHLRAQRLQGRVGGEALAEGEVEFRRGGVVLEAARLRYDVERDMAHAEGPVVVRRGGAVYRGERLELQVQRFAGHFERPHYEFSQWGSGGRARRIQFLDEHRSVALDAWYTSCPRPAQDDAAGRPSPEPAWVLSTRRVEIDAQKQEGVADGAVLRFLGLPILALPRLSFPLGDEAKSGWLPPSVNIDNRSGLELAVPYYWRIAPNLDTTLVPRLMTRRGLGLDTELRYLQPRHEGELQLRWLPHDRLAGSSRESLQWRHETQLPGGARLSLDGVRVSDADWWRDFPDAGRSLTPRLLPARAGVEQPLALPGGEALLYARMQRWQVLQDSASPLLAPHMRSPQLGARGAGELPAGWRWSAETEYNRFVLPGTRVAGDRRGNGERLHVAASLSRPWREPGWWIEPRLTLNHARYGGIAPAAGPALRTVPGVSLDMGLTLERETTAFGRALRQTLEPRLQLLHRPYKAQAHLPVYDAAGKDFNFVSIFSDNAFSGVDRIADASQVTAGVTTRLVDAGSGAEALRLGLVQRVLLRPQRVAPRADGSPDGEPLTQRFSDALLLGSTSVLPGWTLDAALQYSPDLNRSVRTITGARYSPGPFRTVGLNYRLARGLSEQLELGWQWPVWGGVARAAAGADCRGALYSVGRANYSLKDSRVTDAILGFEYDAGCWIGRVVAERVSTGRSQATTRLLLQLELVGLSRIGSNPLKVLRDNIPGYRLLRDERDGAYPADGSP